MKTKEMSGWFLLLLISFIPVLLLFVLGPKDPQLFTYAEFTHKMGQVTALIGMTMFALTFVLATRAKFLENLFGGLDKVYVVHHVLGATALIVLILHPLLLVLKFIPAEMTRAAIYLLPSGIWSINFGIIALTSLIILIIITLYIKMKYGTWKLSHKFMGAVFIFAILHIFLVRDTVARDYIFSGYYVYAGIVSAIGIIPIIYMLFLKNMLVQKEFYTIEKIDIKKDVVGITFKPKGKAIKYKSGQFIFITFYNTEVGTEPHPFSIASRSNDEKVKVFIKGLGDFTKKLNLLKVGDKVKLEGPYGRFNYHRKNADQVWVAGGIGITPFLGMAQDFADKKAANRIDLIYSVKSADEFIELDSLQALEKTTKNLRVFPWVANDKGFLNVDSIKKLCGKLEGKEYYLCGPPPMKDGLRKALISSGIDNDQIYDEVFNLR